MWRSIGLRVKRVMLVFFTGGNRVNLILTEKIGERRQQVKILIVKCVHSKMNPLIYALN